ncbi:hypothetical protein [Microcystis phage Mae-JY22]
MRLAALVLAGLCLASAAGAQEEFPDSKRAAPPVLEDPARPEKRAAPPVLDLDDDDDRDPDDVVGKVVSVQDGDTLTVLVEGCRPLKVRLAEIDAPEKKQPFNQPAKKSLAAMCHGVRATVKVQTYDRYGRAVGRVFCEGVDANREQLARGLAWLYVAFATDESLIEVEAEAREARRGLWSEPNPTPPWEWRRR